MIQYNKQIANDLLNIYNSGEGSLLNNTEIGSSVQIEFIENIIKEYKPSIILETGTNKGCFSFIVSTIAKELNHNVIIHTFDYESNSVNAIKLINQYFNFNNINFYQGNTVDTLRNFNIDNVDLFYVDGGHSYEVACSDINNAKRLNSKLILIDDLNMPDVSRAVNECLNNSEYEFVKRTDSKDDRMMTLYKRKI